MNKNKRSNTLEIDKKKNKMIPLRSAHRAPHAHNNLAKSSRYCIQLHGGIGF